MTKTTYRFPEQLRLKHLQVGECFQFEWDVMTPAWTKRDGTPGEQTVVFTKEQEYQLVSPRKIQAVTTSAGSRNQRLVAAQGKPMGLGKGQGQLPVRQVVLPSW